MRRWPLLPSAVALASLVPLAFTSCSRLRGQTVSPSTSASQSTSADTVARDPIDRTLDRVDAARRRLVAADAAAAEARGQLDSALSDVARLTGHPTDASRALGANDLAMDDHAMLQRGMAERDDEWNSDRWGEDMGRRWARIGERLARRAQRLAQVEATRAQAEAERAARDVQRDMRDSQRDEDEAWPDTCRCPRREDTDDR